MVELLLSVFLIFVQLWDPRPRTLEKHLSQNKHTNILRKLCMLGVYDIFKLSLIWTDSNPYISFVLSIASKIISFHLVGFSKCFQTGSSLFMIAMHSDFLLAISLMGSPLSLSMQPKYLTEF